MTDEKFSAAYDRLLSVFEITTQAQLAKVLDVRQSSISAAKSRCHIPSTWLLAALTQKSVNPSWVLHGYGGQYLTPTDVQPIIVTKNVLQAVSTEELLLELIRRMPGIQVSMCSAPAKV